MNKKTNPSVPLEVNEHYAEKIASDERNAIQINLDSSKDVLSLTSNFLGKSATLELQDYESIPIKTIDNDVLFATLENKKSIFELLNKIVSKAANEICNEAEHPTVEEIAKRVASLLSAEFGEDIVSTKKPLNPQDDYSPYIHKIRIKRIIKGKEKDKEFKINRNIPLDILDMAN